MSTYRFSIFKKISTSLSPKLQNWNYFSYHHYSCSLLLRLQNLGPTSWLLRIHYSYFKSYNMVHNLKAETCFTTGMYHNKRWVLQSANATRTWLDISCLVGLQLFKSSSDKFWSFLLTLQQSILVFSLSSKYISTALRLSWGQNIPAYWLPDKEPVNSS